MPFVANTPESLLGRADSKNPNSTCRGITSTGRPCRRPISRPQDQRLGPSLKLPSRHHRRNKGQQEPGDDPRDETLYCWQHKEQASQSARSSPGPRATATPILEEGRTSLDTLADRLGLVDLQEKQSSRPNGHGKGGGKRRSSGLGGGGRMPNQGPMMTRPKKQQAKKLHFCFCFSIPIEEVHDSPPARPQPRPVQQKPSIAPVPPSSRQRISSQHQYQSSHLPAAANTSPSKNSNRSRRSDASETAQLKRLIPNTVDSVTASALMAELSRPYVDSEEAGYIYMFWLTPATDSKTPPPVDAARSLLAPPPPAASRSQTRRPSDVVSQFAAQNRKTMLLKIGRAANVHRRMNQWQQQCGHDIELLRYYPYVSSSPNHSSTSVHTPGRSTGGSSPRVTPHCHRVERLIHLELAGMGLKASMEACEACGREHREWFEVKTSRDAVRQVDDVIRRWVAWDEGTL